MSVTPAEQGMIDRVNQLFMDAQKTVQGADIRAIVLQVAKENDVPFNDLRSLMLDDWSTAGAG